MTFKKYIHLHDDDVTPQLDHLKRVYMPIQVSLSEGDIMCEMESCFSGMGDMQNAEDCLRRAAEESKMPIRPENIAKVAW